MLHAREDYMRIQDPEGKIPDDEPVFLLRGQDLAAPDAVRFWADTAAALHGTYDTDIVERALKQADAMDQWQRDHQSKVPDMP